MTQEPRDRNRGSGRVMFHREDIHVPVKVLFPLTAWQAKEFAFIQRTPGERSAVLREALIQRAVLERQPRGEADLHLVRHERKIAGFLQGGHLRWAEVAHAEPARFARGAKFRKRAGD